jgi:hypothetical protein
MRRCSTLVKFSSLSSSNLGRGNSLAYEDRREMSLRHYATQTSRLYISSSAFPDFKGDEFEIYHAGAPHVRNMYADLGKRTFHSRGLFPTICIIAKNVLCEFRGILCILSLSLFYFHRAFFEYRQCFLPTKCTCYKNTKIF